MQRFSSMLSKLNELFSDTHQLQRIVIYLGIAFVLAAVSFGSYYYYDRYYSDQPTTAELSIAEAEQAVRDDPNNSVARLDLAEAYMLYRRFDDAVAQANKVAALEPDNERVWLVQGVSYANTGRPADAIEPLTRFVDVRKEGEMPGLDRQLQAAAYYLGDSYLQLGQPENAVSPLEQTVGWSQTDADAMYKLGLAYAGTQQNDQAIYMLLRATTFVPNFMEAYEAMATVFDSMGEPDYANYARGMVAYSQGKYDKALELLLKSVQAKPDFPPAFVGLGLTFEAKGDLQSAKSNYETALMLDPENFIAQNGVQRITIALDK